MTVQNAKGSVIRIGTYNVQNLFLAGEGEAKPARALTALRKVIQRLDADLLVLQEVGSKHTLGLLNEQLPQPYPYFECVPGNSLRSIHLAVLSRLPIQVRSHKDEVLCDELGQTLPSFADALAAHEQRTSATTLQRDVLQVETEALTLFGVHLKSKGNPAWQCVAADEIRSLEAQVVARLVEAYVATHPETATVVLGDFNDLPSSDALAPLSELNWIDPHGLKCQRLGRNPSTYWPKRRMRLDRVLVKPDTVPLIVADSELIHTGELYRKASDHYPVTLDLNFCMSCSASRKNKI